MQRYFQMVGGLVPSDAIERLVVLPAYMSLIRRLRREVSKIRAAHAKRAERSWSAIHECNADVQRAIEAGHDEFRAHLGWLLALGEAVAFEREVFRIDSHTRVGLHRSVPKREKEVAIEAYERNERSRRIGVMRDQVSAANKALNFLVSELRERKRNGKDRHSNGFGAEARPS